ncbi:MAG: type II toxin-antitoxin system HicB family antitoxin [Clostridiales bacterium]|nr:type II toxin-antitoxin system HicB family antitoxin [Clostridiales bacterium]
MSKYVYAAVFTKEENGQYSVTFNDIKGCYTCGDNLEEAIEMAEDALALVLYEYEKEGKEIPKATDISEIKTGENEFVTYIACDTMEYRKMYNNKSVKKTLTIPEWLNEEALKSNINFSAVLQEALQEKLAIG